MADTVKNIKIAISQDGANEVKTALKGILETVVAIERASIVASQAASKKRIDIYKAEADAKKKIDKEFSKGVGSGTGGTRASGPGGVTGRASPPQKSFFESLQKESDIVKGVSSSIAKLGTRAGLIAGAIGLMAGAVNMATEGLKQFGGYLISEVIKPAMALETFSTQIENASNGAITAAQVQEKTRGIQQRWNIDAMTAAEAASGLADKTGNVKLAFDAMEDLAMLSKAYGADLQQLSDMSASIVNLQGGNMSREDLKKIMLTQLAQGQITGGKFTIKDIAGLGGGFLQSASMLAGNADIRAASLGAALQTGGITGKADVSMTNLNSFIRDAGKVLGKGALNKEGQIADLGDAIRKSLIKTGGDASKIRTMGFTDTSAAFIQQYMSAFQDALKKYNGNVNKAADEATATFEKMRTATGNEAQVKAAAAKVMQTTGEQLQSALNQIKMSMVKAMPQVKAFVASLASRAPEIAKAALTLTEALIGLANFMTGLFRETDTRAAREMEKNTKQADLDKQISDNEQKMSDIDEQIAQKKSKGDSTSELESERARLESANIKANADKKAIEEQFNSRLKTSDIISAIASDEGLSKVKNVSGKTAEEKAQNLITMIQRNPDAVDTSGAPFSEKTTGLLKQYRDQVLTDKEKAGSKVDSAALADKQLKSLSETAQELTKNLKAASDATGDVSRNKSIGER